MRTMEVTAKVKAAGVADGLARTYAWYQAQAAAEASERAAAAPMALSEE